VTTPNARPGSHHHRSASRAPSSAARR